MKSSTSNKRIIMIWEGEGMDEKVDMGIVFKEELLQRRPSVSAIGAQRVEESFHDDGVRDV